MDKQTIQNELIFTAMRSSGPGGQHANKVSSKVEVQFDVASSQGLTDAEKARILSKLGSKITADQRLLLQCDTYRSQHKNKDEVVKRLFDLLEKTVAVPKKRKPTKRTKSSVEKRLNNKKKAALKKLNRNKPKLES